MSHSITKFSSNSWKLSAEFLQVEHVDHQPCACTNLRSTYENFGLFSARSHAVCWETHRTQSCGTHWTQICVAIFLGCEVPYSGHKPLKQSSSSKAKFWFQIPVAPHVQSVVGNFRKAAFPKIPTADCTSNPTGFLCCFFHTNNQPQRPCEIWTL